MNPVYPVHNPSSCDMQVVKPFLVNHMGLYRVWKAWVCTSQVLAYLLQTSQFNPHSLMETIHLLEIPMKTHSKFG